MMTAQRFSRTRSRLVVLALRKACQDSSHFYRGSEGTNGALTGTDRRDIIANTCFGSELHSPNVAELGIRSI